MQYRMYGRLFLLISCLMTVRVASACTVPDRIRPLPSVPTGQVSLVTANLWQLMDTHKDGPRDRPVTSAQLNARLNALSHWVIHVLHNPDMLAVQEVENRALLVQLADRIQRQGGPTYRAILREGNDPSGIDVGLLVRDPVKTGAVRQLFVASQYDHHALFSRPPLDVHITKPFPADLVVIHLRSGRGLEKKTKGEWVARKRRLQAQMLLRWIQQRTASTPLILAGDFNSTDTADRYGQPMKILDTAGLGSAWNRIDPADRFSHIDHCQRLAIDQILFSASLKARVTGAAVSRGNAGRYRVLYGRKGAGDVVSDHDALAIYLRAIAPHK